MRRLVDYLQWKITQSRRALGFLRSAAPQIRMIAPRSEETRGAVTVGADNSQKLTHLNQAGAAHMVNISHKAETTRVATAVATLLFSREETYTALSSYQVVKGDAIAVARVAAFQAAKKTADLIPLAHPSLHITAMSVDIDPFPSVEKSFLYTTMNSEGHSNVLECNKGGVTVKATVECQGKTGVEMEAITAATVGAVTMFDMLKAIDKGLVIMGARVIAKQGGKSGDWVWDEQVNRLVRPDASSQPQPSTLHESGVYQPPSKVSEIDEWNKGLTEEFTAPDNLSTVISPSQNARRNSPSDRIDMLRRATGELSMSMTNLKEAMANLRAPSPGYEEYVSPKPATPALPTESFTHRLSARNQANFVDNTNHTQMTESLPSLKPMANTQPPIGEPLSHTYSSTPIQKIIPSQLESPIQFQSRQQHPSSSPISQTSTTLSIPNHPPHIKPNKPQQQTHLATSEHIQAQLRASITSSKPFVEAVGRTFETQMAAEAEIETATHDVEAGVQHRWNKEWWPETMTPIDRRIGPTANMKKIDKRDFENRAFEREWEAVHGNGEWVK